MTTLFRHELTPDSDCHVAAVRLWNYKAAADVRLVLGRRLHVFHGDNGAGKTTILDGIAAGLASIATGKIGSSASGAEWVMLARENIRRRNGAYAAQAAVVLRLGAGTHIVDEEVHDDKLPVFPGEPFARPELIDADAKTWFGELWNQANKGASVPLPVFAYYTADRAAVPEAPRKRWDSLPGRTAALRGAFGAETSYDDLVSWFSTMERAELYEMRRQNDTAFRDPQVETVREAVRRMVPGVKNLAFDPQSRHLQAGVESVCGTNRFSLDELSGGGRVMLALAADLARRMIQANPHLGLDSPAIVLIDEIDLHLHPKWQARVLDDLMSTFPKAQFIVTTHSEQIIGAVPTELVRLVRVEAEGIRVYALDHVEGATYDRILEDEMGLGRRRNKEHQDRLDAYWELVDAGEGESAHGLTLRAELDALFQGKEPELARADIVIRRLRARKGGV